METRTRTQKLTIAWYATFVLVGLMILVIPALLVLPYLLACGLAMATYGAVGRTEHELARPLVYRVPLVALLVLVVVAVAAGGGSMVVHPETGERYLRFGVMAATNVVIAIFAWRALVRPAPRRAALAGGLATVLENLALIGEVIVWWQRDLPPLSADHSSERIAMFAAMLATLPGMVVCASAIIAFRPVTSAAEARSTLPTARVR